jgi:proteic killer suppression protein
MIKKVEISKFAQKQLKKVPLYIAVKLHAWVDDVEERGLEEVRKIPGFHDEPLQGDRLGQRSIKLNRAYRAIYVINENNQIEFVSVEEVSKHDY